MSREAEHATPFPKDSCRLVVNFWQLFACTIYTVQTRKISQEHCSPAGEGNMLNWAPGGRAQDTSGEEGRWPSGSDLNLKLLIWRIFNRHRDYCLPLFRSFDSVFKYFLLNFALLPVYTHKQQQQWPEVDAIRGALMTANYEARGYCPLDPFSSSSFIF